MKKLLIALIVSTLVLSGCGMFRAQHAWKKAKQENPLQIPPEMDRPSTAAALTIPPPTDTSGQASTSPAPETTLANATRMHLSDDVDTAFKRVGLALQQGGLGTVTAQDPARHTYQVSMGKGPELGSSQGFLQKHFSNMQASGDDATTSSSGKLGSGQGTSTVTIQVAPARGGGSTVSASGDPQQAAHVISGLSGRLGG